MCYERRRAEACVDESAHHALSSVFNASIAIIETETMREGEGRVKKNNTVAVFASESEKQYRQRPLTIPSTTLTRGRTPEIASHQGGMK